MVYVREDALLAAQLSKATYENGDYGVKNSLVEQGVILSDEKIEVIEMEGSLCSITTHENSTLVIAFRGTNLDGGLQTFNDFFRDLSYAQAEIRKRERIIGAVHSGFLNRYKCFKHDIHKKVRDMEASQIKKIIITGHSLGGAVATICFIDFMFLFKYDFTGKQVYCLTFGSPRVGDGILRDSLAQYQDQIGHFAFKFDPVTYLPFTEKDHKTESMGGYLIHLLQDLTSPANNNYCSVVKRFLLEDDPLTDEEYSITHHDIGNYILAVRSTYQLNRITQVNDFL